MVKTPDAAYTCNFALYVDLALGLWDLLDLAGQQAAIAAATITRRPTWQLRPGRAAAAIT
jgi:hypothetical protein